MKKQITQNRKISFSENQAPLRSKVIRENKKPFVAKTLRKAIMRRSVLNKTVNNLNDPLAMKLYKNQRNYVVSLSQKTKKDYFRNIPNDSSSKNFWKFCKHFFTNQITNFDDKVMLVENEKALFKNDEIAYLFNTYFNDITEGLNIETWQCLNLP